MELVTGGNSEELGLCPYDFQNIGLNYCAHAHPVHQVVARLEAVRAVQGHRGGERSARIARSASNLATTWCTGWALSLIHI